MYYNILVYLAACQAMILIKTKLAKDFWNCFYLLDVVLLGSLISVLFSHIEMSGIQLVLLSILHNLPILQLHPVRILYHLKQNV